MTAPSVDTTVRVRYAETDAQGVVYHSNYLVYFEVGRGAFLRDLGLDYRAMEEGGHYIVVVEANVRYTASARYDDELVITTTLAELRNRSLIFDYTVRRGEVKVAEGRTAHVCVDDAGKPVRLPDALRARLAGSAAAGLESAAADLDTER
jgi:acyl-CoA thioester hydrolase